MGLGVAEPQGDEDSRGKGMMGLSGLAFRKEVGNQESSSLAFHAKEFGPSSKENVKP